MSGDAVRRLQRTAYHEAGHAVAAVAAWWVSPLSGRVCRFRIGGVSIRPNGRTRGRAHYRPRPNTGGVMQLAGFDGVISLAGYYAEKRFAPSTSDLRSFNVWALGARDGDCRDLGASLDRYFGVPRSEENREAWGEVERLWRKQAREFVRRPEAWRAIEALATRLLEETTLSGGEASAIVRAALKKKGGRDAR